MWAWYMSLHGITFLFATIGFVLLGLFIICGAVLMAVVWIGKLITASMEHDQQRCMCADCRRRRWVAAEKRAGTRREGHAEVRALNPKRKSTVELEEGDKVILRDDVFRVHEIRIGKEGYLVTCTHLRTKDRVVGKISFANATRKLWTMA